MTAGRLVGPALASGLGARGHVAAPVRLADPDVARCCTPATSWTSLASGADSKAVSASVVAPSARVVTVVRAFDEASGRSSSPRVGRWSCSTYPAGQALELARAAAIGPLSVLLVG